MEVDVYFDDWRVGDGDEAIVVGSRWITTLLLDPIYPMPIHVPVLGESQAALQLTPSPERALVLHPLKGEPAGYEFVADTAIEGRPDGANAPCSVLTVAGISFAVMEACQGRVSGSGQLRHDTYLIDDKRVVGAATLEFEVTRVRFVEHVYREVGDDDFVLEGYLAPVDVDTTHARPSPWPPPGGFVITVDSSTASQPAVPAEAARSPGRTIRGLRGRLQWRTRRALGSEIRP